MRMCSAWEAKYRKYRPVWGTGRVRSAHRQSSCAAQGEGHGTATGSTGRRLNRLSASLVCIGCDRLIARVAVQCGAGGTGRVAPDPIAGAMASQPPPGDKGLVLKENKGRPKTFAGNVVPYSNFIVISYGRCILSYRLLRGIGHQFGRRPWSKSCGNTWLPIDGSTPWAGGSSCTRCRRTRPWTRRPWGSGVA